MKITIRKNRQNGTWHSRIDVQENGERYPGWPPGPRRYEMTQSSWAYAFDVALGFVDGYSTLAPHETYPV